jgi:hypothetical protein
VPAVPASGDRDAWAPERALALLRSESGTAFDGACVESLARVVGLGSGERDAATATAGAFAPGAATA